MNSMAPMSTPRVGWPTSSSSGSRSISRASTIFCWLPPEKLDGLEPRRVRPHVVVLHLARRGRATIAVAVEEQAARRSAGSSLVAEDGVLVGRRTP